LGCGRAPAFDPGINLGPSALAFEVIASDEFKSRLSRKETVAVNCLEGSHRWSSVRRQRCVQVARYAGRAKLGVAILAHASK
jgi:hypothetical protein